jgi:hypothetical protein
MYAMSDFLSAWRRTKPESEDRSHRIKHLPLAHPSNHNTPSDHNNHSTTATQDVNAQYQPQLEAPMTYTLDPTVLARSWPDYAVACAGMGVRMEVS